jgi:hypothetical protein
VQKSPFHNFPALLDFLRDLQNLQQGEGVVKSADGVRKSNRFANVGESNAAIGRLFVFGFSFGL